MMLGPRDRDELLKDARRVMTPTARRRCSCAARLTLGGLALLTGCDVTSSDDAEKLSDEGLALERQGPVLAVRSQRAWRRPTPRR